jgi:transmembrane protein TMEM174 (potassium channel)
MERNSQGENGDTHSDRDLSLSDIRLSDTDRLETFSDGVFSITISLLVVDIVRPDYVPGHLLDKLKAQWPNYIAFLASFLRQNYLAQSSCRFFAYSLLQSKPAPGQPLPVADLRTYPHFPLRSCLRHCNIEIQLTRLYQLCSMQQSDV